MLRDSCHEQEAARARPQLPLALFRPAREESRESMGATGYLPLCCHGKLPFWREYLSIGAGRPAADAFAEWMHAGRSEWLAETIPYPEDASAEGTARASDSESVSYRFLFSAPGTGTLLAGYLRPSQDRGGRRFPFATFASLPSGIFGRRIALLPLALEPTWAALEELSRSLGDVTQETQFRDLAEQAQVPPPETLEVAKARHAERLPQVTDHLFPLGPDELPAEAIDEIGRLAERAARSRGAKSPRMELPVADSWEEAGADASFWLDAVNRGFAFQRLYPSMFLEASPAGPSRRLFVLFGAPHPRDYRLLFGDEGDRRSLPRPAAPRAGAGVDGRPAAVPSGRTGARPTRAQLLERAAARKPRLLSLLD